MPSDSREVYELFLSESDPEDAIALLAYGIFEAEKYEWMEHIKATRGGYPSRDEIDQWVCEKPYQHFDRIYDRAFKWMDEFAHNLLADEIEEEKAQAIEHSISSESLFEWPLLPGPT